MNSKTRISIFLIVLIIGALITSFFLKDLFSRGRENFPFKSGQIIDLQIDPSNRPWIQADNLGHLGLWYLDGESWQALQLPDMTGSDEPWQFAIGSKGEIWLAASEGLYVFDGSSWMLHPSADNLLQGDLQFTVDANGFAWLGYRGPERNGLTMFDGETWHQPLTDTNITAVSSSPESKVWVGTDTGDITVIDQGSVVQSFTIDEYSPHNQQFGARSIWDIDFDEQGDAWFAAEARIYHYNGETWRLYTTPDDFVSVSAIGIDRSGQIWMSFFNQIAQYDGHHWQWVFDEHGNYASGSALAKDHQGKIWWVDRDEVRRLDPDTVYFPSISLVRWQRFFSGDGLIFLEISLFLLLVSVWLNNVRPALLTVAFALIFLFVANYFVFPDHWGVTGKLLSAWPIINPGLSVIVGGVIGTLISNLPATKNRISANDLRLTVAGSAIGIVIGLIQIYFFLGSGPLS